MTAPRVSVLMPVYNGGSYIEAAVQSVLDQTYTDFELIAVDDGSKDDSKQRLDAIARRDPRMRVISRPNTGIVGALNDALAVAGGEFVARMDCDDYSVPERFATQVRYLDEHPDVVLVGSRVLLMDADGAPIGDFAGVVNDSPSIERTLFAAGWPIVHPAVMIRGDALRSVNGYRQGTFPYEDHDLFLRLLDKGRLVNIEQPLLHYRRHVSGVVMSSKNTRSVLYDVIDAARQRRGLPPGERPERPPADPRWSQRRDWAWLALGSGHRKTARKLAWLALKEKPFIKESWKALFCAVRGR